jgi:hypothetical protein
MHIEELKKWLLLSSSLAFPYLALSEFKGFLTEINTFVYIQASHHMFSILVLLGFLFINSEAQCSESWTATSYSRNFDAI